MDTKKLEAKIDAVISSRKQSAQEMRGVLIELLLHVYKHGNYPIANRLLSGVKNTKDYKPIVDWVEAFIAYRDWETDRKSTRLNSSHITRSRMPSSA